MEADELDKMNKFIAWSAYYGPKFKELFGFDMPTDDEWHGLDVSLIPYDVKVDIMVSGKYGYEGPSLIYEMIMNNPAVFRTKSGKEK